MPRRVMSDGYERPTTLAAIALDYVLSDEPPCPLAALPCHFDYLTGRFPAFAEGR